MQQFTRCSLQLCCLIAVTWLTSAVIAIHDPAYTGIKTQTYRRDPLIAQAFEQQRKQAQLQQQQQHETAKHGSSERYQHLASGAAGVGLSPAHEQASQRKYDDDTVGRNDGHNKHKNEQQRTVEGEAETAEPTQVQEAAVQPIYKRHTNEYTSACPSGYTGPMPYPYDCRRFLNCWHGRSYIQSCAPGTAFNPETLECDNPEKVVCGINAGFGNRPTSALPPGSRRAERLVDAATKTTSHGSLCPARFTGLQPHPSDCTKFVNCAHGTAYVQVCSPGTAFSVPQMSCDYAHKVNCGARALEQQPEYEPPTQQQPVYAPPLQQQPVYAPTQQQPANAHVTQAEHAYVNREQKAYAARERGSATQPTYGGITSTTARTGDRWSNMDMQRPEPQGYPRTWSEVTVQQQPESTYSSSWQKGSLPANRNYNKLYTAPLAPMTPRTPIAAPANDTNTNIFYAQPVLSQEDNTPDSVYSHVRGTTATHLSPIQPVNQFYPPSRTNHSRAYASNSLSWRTHTQSQYEPSPNELDHQRPESFASSHLLPSPVDNGQQPVQENRFYRPVTRINLDTLPSDGAIYLNHNDQSFGASEPAVYTSVQPTADNLFGGLQPPYIPTSPQSGNEPRDPYATPSYQPTDPYATPFNPPPADGNPTEPTDPAFNPSKGGNTFFEITPIKKPDNQSNTQDYPDELPMIKSRTNVRTFQIYPPTDNVTTHGMPQYSNSYAAVALASFNPRSSPPERENTFTTTQRQGLLPPTFNRQYYKPASSLQPNVHAINDEDTQLPISEALRALLRPYFNRSGTVDEKIAEKADNHIMNVLSRASFSEDEQTDMTKTSRTSTSTTTVRTTTKTVPESPADLELNVDLEEDFELITAGEQESLVTVTAPTLDAPPTQATSTTTARTRNLPKKFGHTKEFHSRHPNMPSPFNDGNDRKSAPPSSYKLHHTHHHPHHHAHHHHRPGAHSQTFSHSREFHLRHPKIPNAFPSNQIDEAASGKGSVQPTAESAEIRTTPATSTVLRIDRRGSFVAPPAATTTTLTPPPCDFDCGNGNCINSFEVCDGVNHCGNRHDERNCSHLGYAVRLAGGETANVGRIEVKILGQWGYVCDDKFGLRDADVVCKELGFQLGALEVRGNSFYAPSAMNPSFVMDEVECRGNETSLKECDFKGWGVHNCGPDEVVGVACKVPQLKCPKNFWLCSTSQECIPTSFVCDNTPDCEDKSDESPQVCNSRVEYRLDGGRSMNEGRLEVLYRGKWGTVCDDDFGLKEAQVACNSLGFFGKPIIEKNIFGPGSGPIWLDQVACFGNETALDKCSHWTWGEHNCNHTEDVGLRCTAGPPPRKTTNANAPGAKTQNSDKTDGNSEEVAQTMLEDIGLYMGQVERSSKFLSRQQRRCGHFKDDLFDAYEHPEKERVLNGTVAKRGRHPWQATIRLKGRGGISSHWCGAVLISKKHLLTAAHCLVGYQKGAYFVRLGDHYANIAESSEIDTFIENWYIHEKFRDKTHMNNDIALIVLKNPIRFNDYIQPICLPEKGTELNVNRMCTISGWGSIKSGVSTPSNILRAAQVPLLADDICRQPHVYGNSMTEGMFCAGLMDESIDACDGDSGGPLVCSDQDGETLYGIISWGQHCGYPNKPGVYVRVEKYIDWIYEKINLSLQQAG